MLTALALAAFVVLVFYVARRIGKRKNGQGLKKNEKAAIEIWTEAEIARIVAERLALDETTVARALAGDPDPDAVTSLERGVRQVEVAYERAPGEKGSADVRLEVSFEDGKMERIMKRIPWTDVPAQVRDEFAKTGGAHVYRPWIFPWQS